MAGVGSHSQSGPPPLFNLTQVLPSIRFTNASLRDILGSIGMSAGINVTFDNTFQDRQYSVQMDNSTLEEALSQITASNQLFYKVQSPRIIIVVPDNVQKRAQYEEQVIRTFFISHADASLAGMWLFFATAPTSLLFLVVPGQLALIGVPIGAVVQAALLGAAYQGLTRTRPVTAG